MTYRLNELWVLVCQNSLVIDQVFTVEDEAKSVLKKRKSDLPIDVVKLSDFFASRH